jgi:hypothetical protein
MAQRIASRLIVGGSCQVLQYVHEVRCDAVDITAAKKSESNEAEREGKLYHDVVTHCRRFRESQSSLQSANAETLIVSGRIVRNEGAGKQFKDDRQASLYSWG